MSRQWQDKCAKALREALELGGSAGRAHWSAKRQRWLTNQKNRVILSDLELSGQDLREYDFSRCWIGGTIFDDANLSGADLSQSIFRGCSLNRTNLSRASFWHADLSDHPDYGENSLVDTQFDASTDMEVNKNQIPSKIDRALDDLAKRAWRRSDWRRQRSRSLVYRFLTFTTNYGFGIGRLFLTSTVVVLVFAGLFLWLQSSGTALDAVSNSIRYFLSLGDPYEAKQPLLAVVGMLESLLGLVALAMFIAIFTSKFTDI